MKAKKFTCFKCGKPKQPEDRWDGRLKPPYICTSCGDQGATTPRPRATPKRLKAVGKYFARLG